MSHSKPTAGTLQQVHRHFEEKQWRQAYEGFQELDAEEPLFGEALDRFALSAALIGDDTAFLALMERIYQLHLSGKRLLRASRAAFWLGFRWMALGEPARSSAWLGRAERHSNDAGQDSVEPGFQLLPVAFRQLMTGELEESASTSTRCIEIGERFEDPDVVAFGKNLLGRAFLYQGKSAEGLALLDESMLAVTEGRLSQLITGLLYCGVITTCQKTFAFGRAQEWTAALTEWCDAQPELVTFQGECRVHRSEVLQFGGEWQEALEQAERAATDRDKGITGHAWYQKAEIQRLRGEIVEAEQSYLRASQLGREPQPGLCLLRAASGQSEAARATLRRLLGEARDSYTRCTYLSAAVEILTTCGATEEARTASEELDAIAAEIGIETLEAVAAQARGRVLLSEGDAPGALGPLRRACFVWQQLGAPYLEARVQVDLGRACRALGDEEGAELLLRGARASFERLGAADTTAVSEARVHGSTNAFGLTARELEVLRLVATGATNKTIAGKLGISEKTVDRHVSNLFSKLKVSTRAGATSLAHEQKLL